MNKRLKFDEILCEIINITEPNGDRHIYFNPPASVSMKYPAIRYAQKKIEKVYANNSAYRLLTPYEVTLMDGDADSEYVEKLLQLPYCEHDRTYKADRLYHHVFTIYY